MADFLQFLVQHTQTTSDRIAIGAALLALFALYLTYRGAKIQLETFIMTLLCEKAREANTYFEIAENDPSKKSQYEHALASIIQGLQIYTHLRCKHRLLLLTSRRDKFMHVYILQFWTTLQGRIFDGTGFEDFLIKDRNEQDKKIISSYFTEIRKFLGKAHKYYHTERTSVLSRLYWRLRHPWLRRQ